MRILLSICLIFLTAALVAITFLALWPTNLWWVRMTDFPRLQYAILLAALLIFLTLARSVSVSLRMGLAALGVVALSYNGWKLFPYFPSAIAGDSACGLERQLSIMVANVKLTNQHAEALLEIVRERNPDILLTLETTEWWDRQLSTLSDEMPYAVSKITGSYFGMHLFSRLPLSDTEVVVPVDQNTPAILATVRLPSNDPARILGVHPRPPHPGQSSIGRDAVLMWAALRAKAAGVPVVLAGDFNAVPWERTVERLQRIGAFIDPRRAFGFLPTYDAQSWWMAWPLD